MFFNKFQLRSLRLIYEKYVRRNWKQGSLNTAMRVLTVAMLGFFSIKWYHANFIDTFRIVANFDML
jgi:hypothetical protein